MGLIAFIFWTIVIGAIIGGLGRLAIPGPNPMTVPQTILVGIAGAFLGGIVAVLLDAGDIFRFILQVAAAAAIIYFLQRRKL